MDDRSLHEVGNPTGHESRQVVEFRVDDAQLQLAAEGGRVVGKIERILGRVVQVVVVIFSEQIQNLARPGFPCQFLK